MESLPSLGVYLLWIPQDSGCLCSAQELEGGVTVVSANPTTIPKLLLIHHLPCCYGWTNGQVTEPTYKRTEDFCWGCRKCFSFPNKMQDPRAPSSSLSPDLMWTRPLESQQSSFNQAGQARRPADVTDPTSLSQ